MTVLASHPELFSRESLVDHGLKIAVIVALSLLVFVAARLAVGRMQRRLEGVESETQELNLQRAATLTQAVSYVVRVLVWTIAILLILGEIGISLGPLIAGAGVAGVALGFGAQSLVRDYLSGFFILLENQLGVGDGVQVLVGGQTVDGRVETLSLRTTELRGFDGTLHIIPNGNVLLVSNRTRGWARAIIDVAVPFGENLDRVRGVLEELFEELRRDENIGPSLSSGPELLGVEQLAGKDAVIRVVADTRPTRKGGLERTLRTRIMARFAEKGIAAAAPPA
jgi:small-conductance mechanosensitive channel